MTLETIKINGKNYNYYNPTDYRDMKLYLRQVKRVREKIRACESGGCYAGKVSKKGIPYYHDYPEFLAFLETLLKDKVL
jgi:hypothetical protein